MRPFNMLLVCLGFFSVTKHTHSLAGAWYLEEVLIVNMKVLVVNVKHPVGCSLNYKIPRSGFFCRLFNFSSFIFSMFCFFLFLAADRSS